MLRPDQFYSSIGEGLDWAPDLVQDQHTQTQTTLKIMIIYANCSFQENSFEN